MNQPVRRYFLAIRHRPSGAMLPNVRGFGFTRTQPSFTDPPRLFTRESSARSALKYWLEGEHFLDEDKYEQDFYSEVTLHVRPRRDRKPEDMEIVEVEVVVRTLSQAQLREL